VSGWCVFLCPTICKSGMLNYPAAFCVCLLFVCSRSPAGTGHISRLLRVSPAGTLLWWVRHAFWLCFLAFLPAWACPLWNMHQTIHIVTKLDHLCLPASALACPAGPLQGRLHQQQQVGPVGPLCRGSDPWCLCQHEPCGGCCCCAGCALPGCVG
jgi:hypothetical protein